MTKQNTKSAMADRQTLFDPKGYQDVFKTWAQNSERMMALAAESATRSTDIASETAKEAFSNLREVTKVRNEPADYGKAYSDFAQKQMDLFMRTAQTMSEVGQKTGAEARDLATKAGEDMSQKAQSNAQSAADKATSAAKKAA